MSVAVIGGGSFGTALSQILAEAGNDVFQVMRDEAIIECMNIHHENPRYLPNVILSKKIIATKNPTVLRDCNYWIIALPCQKQADILPQYKPYFGELTTLINVAKGIVLDKLLPLSMVVPKIFGLEDDSSRYAVLSGPSFAKEVALNLPTACVLACSDENRAAQIRDIFVTPYFRCYSTTDVLGVELGGAVKNIYAIGAGIVDGLGYGDNARAALVTRGLAEMARLGMAMGAFYETFMGLSGLGDLSLTCNGDLSRNRQVGLRLGKGEKLADIIASMNSVAEGVPTTKAVSALAKSLDVDMPIVFVMERVLSGELTPQEGLIVLMNRARKAEKL